MRSSINLSTLPAKVHRYIFTLFSILAKLMCNFYEEFKLKRFQAKLQQYEDGDSKMALSVRKKRQTVHDQNRSSDFETKDASTNTKEGKD